MLPLLPGWLLLLQADETTPLQNIVSAQAKSDVLYGTAIHGNEVEHKLALVARRNPSVVALGSSRMEQFRQEFFDQSFVCVCTVMGAIEDAEPLIDEILHRHKPKVVLFGVDYWWFSDVPQGRNVHSVRKKPNKITLQKLMLPIEWWKRGRLSTGQYWATIFQQETVKTLPGYQLAGLSALLNGRGVRPDGSVLHGNMLFASASVQPSQDINVMRERVRIGHPLYPHKSKLKPSQISILEQAISKLGDAGVRVIVILPPMLPLVVDLLDKSDNHAYVSEIIAALSTAKPAVHNYHDARSIGATGCEFLDDRHAGDVTNMRILIDIAKRNKDGDALPWTKDKLIKAVERFSGRALAQFDPAKFNGREGDFLKLGCAKS